jgi:hypothetical protein
MDSWFADFFADPMKYIAYMLVFVAACGAILFFGGFGSGARHLFTFGESSSHMQHARVRIVWGILLIMAAWGWWEIFRVIAGQEPLSYLWLALLLLTPVWIPWVRKLFSGGH